jgi:hypothetical protein
MIRVREGEDKREREGVCHVIDPDSFSANQIVEFSCPRIVCFLCTVDRIESNGLERIWVFPYKLICRRLSNYTRQITDLP